MKKRVIVLLSFVMLLFGNNRLQAQGVKMGEKVPAANIAKIIHYKHKSVNLQDFKDRLLILDFWDTNCSGCVAALPRMEKLQQQFGDSIAILPVTTQPEQMILDFLSKNKHTKDVVIPSVVDDKTLSRLFKHETIPHEVWIYKGKVIGLTESDYVDADNIRLVMSGEKNDWPVKDDYTKAVDLSKPLLGSADTTLFRQYSALMAFRPNVYGKFGMVYDSLHHMRRIYFSNNLLTGAYYYYWYQLKTLKGQTASFAPAANRVIINAKSPDRFRAPKDKYGERWRRKYLYCYESAYPDTGSAMEDVYLRAINDLNYLLGVQGRYEQRTVTCMVLVRKDSIDRIRSAGGDMSISSDDPSKPIKNTSLSSLVYILNSHAENPPVFDETGYTGNVDLQLSINSWTDMEALRNALQRYGLDLKTEERTLEMFVLTDKPGS
jgi:thiol-disulfide isomerase/thioredoxin